MTHMALAPVTSRQCSHRPPFTAARQGASRRAVARCQARCTGEAAGSSSGEASTSRRGALSAAAAVALGAALLPSQAAHAAEGGGPTAAAADPAAAPAAAAPVDAEGWPSWVDRTFSFRYPPELLLVESSLPALPPVPGERITQPRTESAVKVELRSPDGTQRLNVVVQKASKLKQTLLQVTDIAQMGDVREVARLLLPPGALVADADTLVIQQPDRDTGTVLGQIKRDPITLYRYEVLLPNAGARVHMAVGAQLGNIYVMGGTAPEGQWSSAGPGLQAAARSFRLLAKK